MYPLKLLRNVTRGGVNPAHSKGFTLAEVLITLGVIGIISAITLPSVIKNYKNIQTVNQLKATYSIMSQAVKASELENGTTDTWDIPQAEWGKNSYKYGKEFSEKYLLPYLKNIRICNFNTNECFPDNVYYLHGHKTPYLSGTSNYFYNFVLSNGTVVGIWTRGTLAEVHIDLNGKKNPNVLGKDNFNFVITKEKGLLPAGYYKTDSEIMINCNQSGSSGADGNACLERIIRDGWKIKY